MKETVIHQKIELPENFRGGNACQPKEKTGKFRRKPVEKKICKRKGEGILIKKVMNDIEKKVFYNLAIFFLNKDYPTSGSFIQIKVIQSSGTTHNHPFSR